MRLSRSADEACSRVTFELAYCRGERRTFHPWGMSSQEVDSAFGDHKTNVDWSHEDFPSWETDADWLRLFFRIAIGEAIHEALEWFQVDGQPVLDPHSWDEDRIIAATEELADRLWKFPYSRARHAPMEEVQRPRSLSEELDAISHGRW
jgi:hypothetical protein